MGCTEKMQQMKSYDDMFQAIRALTVQKILKIRILSQTFLQNERFSRFLPNALMYIVLQEKIQPYTLHSIVRTALNILFQRKFVCRLLNSKR